MLRTRDFLHIFIVQISKVFYVKRNNFKSIGHKSWVSIVFLIVIALWYCAPALTSPFWGANDSWSNLLPIIHYRISILEEHTFPSFTKLWYGGRYQWQNPLWGFLYFPATIIWLITPLDWGARIVFAGHLIFSLIAGRKLSSLFLKSEVGRISTAIILTSPMLPALLAGHIEKVMAWGWLLLSIYFLLNERKSLLYRGVCSGLCWGIMALAGANYHVLYTGLLLVPLALTFKKPPLLISLLSGATIGLFHLPSVWYLIGVTRSNPIQSIAFYSIDVVALLESLTFGFSKRGWESWALMGIPVIYLFVRSLFLDIKDSFTTKLRSHLPQKIILLLSLTILSLLATGALYKGHHFLDTFRVPVRAVSLIAVVMMLYVLLSFASIKASPSYHKQETFFNLLLLTSAIQVSIMAVLLFRPSGTHYNQYDLEAQNLVKLLKSYQAKSVWLSKTEFNEMHVHAILSLNGIALPNIYYGDMGQTVPVNGPFCGYSFDYLISKSPKDAGEIELMSDITNQVLARISSTNLRCIDQFTLHAQTFNIYRIICSPHE